MICIHAMKMFRGNTRSLMDRSNQLRITIKSASLRIYLLSLNVSFV
jgi:hypothetical protein